MKTKKTILKSIFNLLLFFLLIVGCKKEASYKYEVTGTSGSYSVTIQNSDDNTQQWSKVGNGWTYIWSQTGERWLYVSAQNNNSTGNVTVKIIKNGKVITQNTSYGGYSIATASGNY
jgi:hypothetical protein